jgi:hypothetical protein
MVFEHPALPLPCDKLRETAHLSRCAGDEVGVSARQRLEGMNVLEIWLASSPELNPTEMAWSIIGRKLVTANVKTKAERVCNEVDEGMIDRPMLDF